MLPDIPEYLSASFMVPAAMSGNYRCRQQYAEGADYDVVASFAALATLD